MKNLLFKHSSFLLMVALLASCSSYRQNIMFKVPKNFHLQEQVKVAEHNYIIQKNDVLKLDVFTNDGERLIDPNYETIKNSETQNARPSIEYLVNDVGVTKFPMIGELKVEGLTLQQAEEILQKEYSKFYQQPFVILKYNNKRVVILGSPGGQLIPLINQNVRLVEVLAMARGIDNNGKAQNIRVLRGEQIFVADLSTIDGYLKNNMLMEPGDIVYVEPVRRPLIEAVRDYGPVLGVFSALATLVLILTN